MNSAQLVMGVIWAGWGAWYMAADGTFPTIGGSILMVLGLSMAIFTAVSWRAGVEADDVGLRWRSLLRSTDVRWTVIERVVIEDRGSPYGTKVAIDIEAHHGQRYSVPQDALSGLEEEKHAELRQHLLTAVGKAAAQAGVLVTHPPGGGPPIP